MSTSASEDNAMLKAAHAGQLAGVTPRIEAAIAYRLEHKRVLDTAVKAMATYIEWLYEDAVEVEVEVGEEEESEGPGNSSNNK